MTLEIIKIIALLCVTHGGPVPYERQSLCQSKLISCMQNQKYNTEIKDVAERLSLCVELKE